MIPELQRFLRVPILLKAKSLLSRKHPQEGQGCSCSESGSVTVFLGEVPKSCLPAPAAPGQGRRRLCVPVVWDDGAWSRSCMKMPLLWPQEQAFPAPWHSSPQFSVMPPCDLGESRSHLSFPGPLRG